MTLNDRSSAGPDGPHRGVAAGSTTAVPAARSATNMRSDAAGDTVDAHWFDDAYRLIHWDAHFGQFRQIYADFDAEAAAQMLGDAGFQMISCFSKCWAGYSYYPTRLGVQHPGLERDFCGEFTRALKKRGIKCIMYFMLQMERRCQQDHPEWIRNADPSIVEVSEESIGTPSTMCINTPYLEQVAIPQLKEILGRYDVDGFFMDIFVHQFLSDICYCRFCRGAFQEEIGGDIPVDDRDPSAFAWRKLRNRSMEERMALVQHALEQAKPDISNIYNWSHMVRYPVKPPPYVRHISWDTPIPGVGLFSWNFSVEARYLSSLSNVTWSCMSVRGNGWGEYSLREPEAFLSESAILLGACGRTYLSDVPYPHGNPDPAVYAVYGSVNERTRELEPYLKGCRPVRDTAVLHSADSVWSKKPLQPTNTWEATPAYHSVCGAHKALIEGHVQMAILNSEDFVETLDEYGAVILPDQVILSDRECQVIRRYVDGGGVLIATCETGTRDASNQPLGDFSIADVLGVEYLGTSDTSPNCYLRMQSEDTRFGIPAMDIQVSGSYAQIRATTAKTLLELVPPYEGIGEGTPPPALETEGPGVTVNSCGRGKAIYCAPSLFAAYYGVDTPVIRKLGLWLLDLVYPDGSRSVSFENAPINVETFYNERGHERFVHLVNFSGDKRERSTPQVQDFTTAHGIRVHVRLDVEPVGITSVPGGRDIPFTFGDGHATFEAQPLAIHNVYRIEL